MRIRVAVGIFVCCLVCTACTPSQPAAGRDPTGIWQGLLQTGVVGLRFVLEIRKAPGGGYQASGDSPDQGAFDIKAAGVQVRGERIEVSFPSLRGRFEGRFASNGNLLQGRWEQGDRTLALILRRTNRRPDRDRPQNPRPPFPYRQLEVTFTNTNAAIALAGTLTIPRGKGPFPAAVLISGSGAQDRDETLMGHKPFLVLADHLTRRGIAVLRYDDRGFGKSGGSFAGATTRDFADDAEAALAFLGGRREIDAHSIGLIGHSEGGIVAPMVAARNAGVAFIVMLAGSGLPGEDILIKQGELIAWAEGASVLQIEENRSLQRQLFALLKQEKDEQQLRRRALGILQDRVSQVSREDRQKLGITRRSLQAQVDRLLSPWMRFFIAYDPRPALRRVRCPVLALIGANDLQVSARENLAAIRTALQAGGNRDYTVRKLPGLNHLFQHSKSGALSEYSRIEETMAPSILRLVSDWIRRRFSLKAQKNRAQCPVCNPFASRTSLRPVA